MKVHDAAIRVLKHTYRAVTRKTFLPPECDCDRQSANDRICRLLASGGPCMIARFGTTEINCVDNYLCVHRRRPFVLKCWDYISDCTHTPWWYTDHFQTMSLWSGIFPVGQATAERFSERYLRDIPEIDLLACHQYYERFMPLRPDVERVQLEMLYPFFVDRPWTRILRGKRVLVVHPFEATIRQQYARRRLLFESDDILPDCELLTLRAVQTIAGAPSQFADWFEALAHMERQVEAIDFDVAIIGCGAYGLPLAAHVKRMGRQAVHMAGGTQLLFGIKGNRWLTGPHYQDWQEYRPGVRIRTDYKSLFNDHWTFPLDCDTPAGAQLVEGACYWR